MSWIEALYKTYENHLHEVGIKADDKTILLPISHSTQNAQIEIVISNEGELIRAIHIGKEDAITIIPVTEDSASRSSGIAPHPLCDKLIYIAGDYVSFIDSDKKDKLKKYYLTYIEQLKQWVTSDYSHDKIKAIYRYLKKETVIKDLVDEGILELDDNGVLSSSLNKMQKTIAQADAFVRFRVRKQHDTDEESKVWVDRTLYKSYLDYYNNLKSKQENGICYVTGEWGTTSEKHIAKTRNSGDKAKLISANDTNGFTYRGRFWDKAQPVSLGYITSQKAHLALRWLIQKQGYTQDDAAIVAWIVEGSKSNLVNTLHPLDPRAIRNDLSIENNFTDTASSYAKRLNNALAGYSSDLTTSARIVVMAVDAATPGRLAITYYRELKGSEFIDRVQNWHQYCSWTQVYKNKEGEIVRFTGAPSPRQIALTAFGTEQGGMMKADSKLIRQTVERLLPCIIDGRKFPKDILRAAVNKVSRPQALSAGNWNRQVAQTCAMIKKYYYDRNNQEVLEMALDKNNMDRDYLFGRLLAVIDRIEYRTFEQGEKRETNAKRYWEAFTKKPARTVGILQTKLLPYMAKLKSLAEKATYERMISEIISSIGVDGFNDNPLKDIYLVGYWSQVEDMRYKSKDTEQQLTEELNNE